MEALVLCVDDDRTALMLNEAIFAQTGSKVSCANSGVEAVASLGKDAADVVILDYAMPEIDGYATALEIRTLQPRVPIVVSTGSDPVPDDFRNIADGCHRKGKGQTRYWKLCSGRPQEIDQLREYLFEPRRAA